MNIGNKIRELRIKNNLSQDELAKLVGYNSRSAINKIEKGVNDITQSKIILFAKALNTTPSDLLDWDIDEPVGYEHLKERDYLTELEKKFLDSYLKLSKNDKEAVLKAILTFMEINSKKENK